VTPSVLCLNGQTLWFDPEGVIYWPERRMLIVADLHLEKGTAFMERGVLLPPYDTRETLGRLLRIVARYRPDVVVALGDNFHDRAGGERLGVEERAMIAGLAERVDLVWVAGNHDPAPMVGIPGRWVEELRVGEVDFRHMPCFSGVCEVVGHFHPKARVSINGHGVTRACFVADEQRVIMPAFGAYAGGLDVRDAAIRKLFPDSASLFLLGKERLFRFALD